MVETGAGGVSKVDLGNLKEDIIAAVDETYDLGSIDKKWAAIWVAIALVTSITIGGAINLSNVDGWLFINASTSVNGSMNISEDLNVSGTLTAGSFDITNLTIKNMNFTNLTLTGDVFNISATETYVNDLFPNEYCTSDLGSIALRWDNGYFCHNVSAEYFVGSGEFLTGVSYTETDPLWTGNYTAYNSSWSSTYNATYDAKVSFPGWDVNLAWINQTNIFTANQNLTGQNISTMNCIIFDSGGKICSGV